MCKTDRMNESHRKKEGRSTDGISFILYLFFPQLLKSKQIACLMLQNG